MRGILTLGQTHRVNKKVARTRDIGGEIQRQRGKRTEPLQLKCPFSLRINLLLVDLNMYFWEGSKWTVN